MNFLRVFGPIVLSCSACACTHASAPAPRLAPPPVAAPAPDPFGVTVEWKAEQIKTPAGAWLRLKSPAAALPRLISLASEPRLAGFSNLKAMAGLVLGGELSSLIDFDAPIDALVVPAEEPVGAHFAVAAQPSDAAHFDPKKLGTKLRPLADGRWEIDPAGGSEGVRCELWHVAAPVGHRIVCGREREEIAELAPFLLGRLARQPFTSDARLELSHALLAQHLGEALSKFDDKQPSQRMARAELEGIASAESISLGLALLEQDIELGIEARYRADGSSPALESFIAAKDKQALPPQFWQVLDDSPIACAAPGTDEASAEQLARSAGAGWHAFEEQVRAAGGFPEDHEGFKSKLSGVFTVPFRFTLSHGGALFPSTASPAKPTASGFWLIGFAGSGERYRAALDEVFATSGEAPNPAPSVSKPTASAHTRMVRLGKLPRDLPPESIVWRGESATHATWFTWVLPSSDWIWMLHAESKNSLFDQVRRFLPKLSAPVEPDAEQRTLFGATPPLFACSVSLAALKNIAPEHLRELDVAALPFGGSARVFVRLTGEAQPHAVGAPLTLGVWSRWSPAALADLVALIKGQRSRAKSGESPP